MIEMIPRYNKGDIVSVLDRIDLITETVGTVKACDYDPETGAFYLYIVANNMDLNIHNHPTIGIYFTVIENTSPYLRLVHPPI